MKTDQTKPPTRTLRPSLDCPLAILLSGALLVASLSVANAADASSQPGGLFSTEQGSDAWKQSVQFEQAGNYKKAIESLKPMPKSYALELRLGWLEYLCANNEDSARHYEAAISLAPGSADARLGSTLPLMGLGKFAAAESAARSVLEKQKLNYTASARLAWALRMQKKFDEADRVLIRAMLYHPNDPVLLVERGLALVGMERLTEARSEFTEALKINPANEVALAQVGYVDNRSAAKQDAIAPHAAFADWSSPFFNTPSGMRSMNTESRADALLYFAYGKYSDTTLKDYANLAGLYASIQVGAAESIGSTAEVELDLLDLHYKNLPTLRQTDLTLAVVGTPLEHVKVRYGGHFIFSDDTATDHGWNVFLGTQYFEAWKWDAGADVGYSKYPNFIGGLDVVQVSPHIGINVLQGTNYTLRCETRGYWIHPSQSVAGRDHFFSGEERVSFYYNRWMFAGFGWIGKQAFALRPDSHALFNVAEEHTGGFGAEAHCDFTPKLGLTARASREIFREPNITTDSFADIFTLLFNFSF